VSVSSLSDLISSVGRTWPVISQATATRNLRVLKSFLGPAYRGFFQQCTKAAPSTIMSTEHSVNFNWRYNSENPELTRLYEAAKSAQWSASTDIDWTRTVDPFDIESPLIPDKFLPASTLPIWGKLTARERAVQRHAVLSWFLSQFLHGEQGALFAATQVIQAVPWLDVKLLGSTQVVDEGRHVEVFHRYLSTKLEKLYEISDNLYVVIDAIMQDSRWDMKFLGMQIMVEGFALAAFGSVRRLTTEPLLRDVIKNVIADEARHVHFGVLVLERLYKTSLTEVDRREREDWAFEVCLFLQRRFLLHEIYDEFYGHAMSRAAWNRLVSDSEPMLLFRKAMFQGIMPNLKRLGLLSKRIQPRYAEAGVLQFAAGKAAPELTANELVEWTA